MSRSSLGNVDSAFCRDRRKRLRPRPPSSMRFFVAAGHGGDDFSGVINFLRGSAAYRLRNAELPPNFC